MMFMVRLPAKNEGAGLPSPPGIVNPSPSPSPSPSFLPPHPLPVSSHVALASPEADAALLHEALVMPEQHVLLHLLDGVEADANDDQERGAAEEEALDVEPVEDEEGEQRDPGQVERAGDGDAAEHVVDVFGGPGAGLDARHEGALL